MKVISISKKNRTNLWCKQLKRNVHLQNFTYFNNLNRRLILKCFGLPCFRSQSRGVSPKKCARFFCLKLLTIQNLKKNSYYNYYYR